MPFDKMRFPKILGVFPTLERDERFEFIQQLEQNAEDEASSATPV